MAHLARFRGLSIGKLVRAAKRLLARLWHKFQKKRGAALASLPAGARARAMGMFGVIRALEAGGFHDQANAIYRKTYRMLDLEIDARRMEEVAEAFNASLNERLRGGQLGGERMRLFRFAGGREVRPIAERAVLAHGGDQGHLSWSLREDTWFKKRPVALSLGLTCAVTPRLAVVPYRSPAFSAPGSRPAHLEAWRGTKSWEAMDECEVRLRTPVPARGLDLTIRLRTPVSDELASSLRRLCGRRKAFVARSWPLNL